MQARTCPLTGNACVEVSECQPAYLASVESGTPPECPILAGLNMLAVVAQALLPLVLGNSDAPEDITDELTPNQKALLDVGISLEEQNAGKAAV